METPPAFGRDMARLQRQLDASAGQHLPRRCVSRPVPPEETFYTPVASPMSLSAPMAQFASPHGSPHSSPQCSPYVPSGPTASPGTYATPRQLPQRMQTVQQVSRASHHSSPLRGQPHPPRGLTFKTQPPPNGPVQNNGRAQNGPEQTRNVQNEQLHTHKGVHHGHSDHYREHVNTDSVTQSVILDPSIEDRKKTSDNNESLGASAGSAHALGSRRRCQKCNGDITGHFVRALGHTYHIGCFTCEDCGTLCASKFFPFEGKPLCERCYFKRQNLLCYRCNNSLGDSYITALDRKYHVDHFTCSLCTTVFGPDDSYFEYNGDVYCRAHYAALFAFKCEGCKSPILKQFVETYRGGKQQQWHPECYMIFKFWSVKVADPSADEVAQIRAEIAKNSDRTKPLDSRAASVIAHEEAIDKRTLRTWTTLCGFEEYCAAAISMLVQHAFKGEFREAHDTCARLVALIKVLFQALDVIPHSEENPQQVSNEAGYKEPGREAKTLCRKIVSYMSLLSKTRQQAANERVAGLAPDLLSLASAMAHYLKVLIRQGLAGALQNSVLDQLLSAVSLYSTAKPAKAVSPFSTDRCVTCNKSVEDRCYCERDRSGRIWHARSKCFQCTQTGEVLHPNNAAVDAQGQLVLPSPQNPPVEFVTITKFEQYVILLHVALARLDLVLSNHRRPKSQGTSPTLEPISGQSSVSAPFLPGQKTDQTTQQRTNQLIHGSFDAPTALERASLILHEKVGLTLDDIRRIVAGEQARSSVKLPSTQTTETESPSEPEDPNKRKPSSSSSSSSVLPATQKSKRKGGEQGPMPVQLLPVPPDHDVHGQPPKGRFTSPAVNLSPPSELAGAPAVNDVQQPAMAFRRGSGVFYGTLSEEEYTWVRYISQAMLQSYVEDHTQGDTLQVLGGSAPGGSGMLLLANLGNSTNTLVSSSSSTSISKQRTLWERMGKVFTIKEQDSRVFGQPLDRIVAKYGVDSSQVGVNESAYASGSGSGPKYTLRVPSFIDDCVCAMRQKDVSVEGIFRKNGNIRRLREFVEKIDRNPYESGLLVDESPIQLAALLKKFLRDLPDPVMLAKLTPLWSVVPSLAPASQARLCQLLVAVLPRPNRSVLEVLVYFLNWVSMFAQIDDETGSKMDISNLATVLAPTLAISQADSAVPTAGTIPGTGTEDDTLALDVAQSNKAVIETVKLLITDGDLVSQVPVDIVRMLKRVKGTPKVLRPQELKELMG